MYHATGTDHGKARMHNAFWVQVVIKWCWKSKSNTKAVFGIGMKLHGINSMDSYTQIHREVSDKMEEALTGTVKLPTVDLYKYLAATSTYQAGHNKYLGYPYDTGSLQWTREFNAGSTLGQ